MLAPLSEETDLQWQIALLGSPAERDAAMTEVFNVHKMPLMSFLMNKYSFLQEADALDAIQETFRTVWEQVCTGTFNPKGSLASLLFTIAKRRAVDIVRKRGREVRSSEEIASGIGEKLAGTQVGEAWALAQKQSLIGEIQREFRSFVGTLPPRQKMVATVMADHLPDWLSDQEIVDEVFRRRRQRITALEVKGAKQALMKKFRAALEKVGLL